MRVLVCTAVHNPADARILHRQIRALLDAGHDVTYIAPFRQCRVTPWPGLTVVDVPRATGRTRLRALRAARREVRGQLGQAQAAGLVRWYGFVPNGEALKMVDGALAGLSLLHDEPNYRHSLPTKVVEYMAHGVPVITSPFVAQLEEWADQRSTASAHSVSC